MSTGATCTVDSYKWTFNSIGQSPCWVGAYLSSACTGNPPTLNAQLPATWHYDGPSKSGATPCKCSTVYYNIISACAACQGGEYLTWSQWNTNCSSVWSETFPAPIPPGTRVPHYGFLPVGVDDRWNAVSAQSAGGTESSAGGAAATSVSTLPGGSVTTIPGPAPTNYNGGGSKKKSNAGAIAGGVVAGVVGLILIAIIAILAIRRRNANKKAPSALIDTSQLPTSPAQASFLAGKPSPLAPDYSGGQPVATVPYNFTGSSAPHFPQPSVNSATPMKLYDPSDPSTFPTFHTPTAETTPLVQSNDSQILRPLSRLNHPNDSASHVGYARGYTGGPEV